MDPECRQRPAGDRCSRMKVGGGGGDGRGGGWAAAAGGDGVGGCVCRAGGRHAEVRCDGKTR